MHQRYCLIAAILVCLLAAAIVLARRPLLLAIGDFLIVEDALHDADVIHVIAGPDDRTDYAIQLYKQGYARRILFTGGWCTCHSYYHGQHGRERALEQGVTSHSRRIYIDRHDSSVLRHIPRMHRS